MEKTTHTEEVIIDIKNLSKTFYINDKNTDTIVSWLKNLFQSKSKKRKLDVLRKISFQVYKGETFGVIGRNGSGKSTLLKLISGAYQPDKGGTVKKMGKSMLMNLKIGMSPELTSRQNVYVLASALGMRIKEVDLIFDRIIEFAELEEFIDTKIRNFSNGMVTKLAFSVAVNAKADIMFLDEVFAVGDKKFRQKAVKLFEQNWLEGRTVVMVSHSLGNIRKYCDRVLYLKDGMIRYLGDPNEAIRLYEEEN